MARTPWLSVLMPTYNGAQFLPETLDSVVAQQASDVEVIAVDDGSTDETVKILYSYSDRLALHVVEQDRVGNWVVGTNRGLSLAAGRYVSLLHQDDLWRPGRVATLRKALEGDTRDAFAVHPVLFVDESGRGVGRWRCPLPANVPLSSARVIERLLVQNFIPILGTAFPRDLTLELGGMKEELWYTADWDLWLRLAGRTATLHVPSFLGAVRLHRSSITATRSAGVDQFRWQLESVLQAHLQEWPEDGARKRRVTRAAMFSVDVNVALAGLTHGHRAPLLRLFVRFLLLGPRGWWRYFRDSRILERAGARRRAGFGRPAGPRTTTRPDPDAS